MISSWSISFFYFLHGLKTKIKTIIHFKYARPPYFVLVSCWSQNEIISHLCRSHATTLNNLKAKTSSKRKTNTKLHNQGKFLWFLWPFTTCKSQQKIIFFNHYYSTISKWHQYVDSWIEMFYDDMAERKCVSYWNTFWFIIVRLQIDFYHTDWLDIDMGRLAPYLSTSWQPLPCWHQSESPSQSCLCWPLASAPGRPRCCHHGDGHLAVQICANESPMITHRVSY